MRAEQAQQIAQTQLALLLRTLLSQAAFQHMGPETKPHIWETTGTSAKCIVFLTPILFPGVLWARLQRLLFYNQSNKKIHCFYLYSVLQG